MRGITEKVTESLELWKEERKKEGRGRQGGMKKRKNRKKEIKNE